MIVGSHRKNLILKISLLLIIVISLGITMDAPEYARCHYEGIDEFLDIPLLFNGDNRITKSIVRLSLPCTCFFRKLNTLILKFLSPHNEGKPIYLIISEFTTSIIIS